MARTGETSLKIKNNGVVLTGSFNTLDFAGTIAGTDEGGGVVLVTGSGGGSGSNFDIQPVTPVTSGSNITLDLTTLPHVFTAIKGINKNGQLLTQADATFGWSVTGNTATVLNAGNTDQFEVEYNY